MVTFNNVLDRAYTTLITDYKLDKLKKMEEESFYTFLGGFLANSIDMFDGCLSDLSYHKVEEKNVEEDGTETIVNTYYAFDNELTNKEIYILSLGVAIGWYRKAMDDITQFEVHLNSKDFKSFSEANNLQRRVERLEQMEENFAQEINNYQISKFDSLPFFGGN